MKYAISKAEQKRAGLISGKRVALCSMIHILLHTAPVWRKVIGIDKNRRVLEKAQRGMLLRVISAYKTVSLEALHVIAAV